MMTPSVKKRLFFREQLLIISYKYHIIFMKTAQSAEFFAIVFL